MGPTLNTAVGDERLCADRPRHLARRSRTAATSTILVEGDKRLFNQYGVMLVNPGQASAREGKDLGRRSSTGSSSPEGQDAIAGYKIGGEQLFFPNAPAAELKKAG